MVNMKLTKDQRKRNREFEKAYYKENKEKLKSYQREYEAKKRADIDAKLERLEKLETYLKQQGIAI